MCMESQSYLKVTNITLLIIAKISLIRTQVVAQTALKARGKNLSNVTRNIMVPLELSCLPMLNNSAGVRNMRVLILCTTYGAK
uniref:Uncharacterized protein n=1 Tax=Ditylenchus dipsaci TaxID=166011 RepID=A0A915DJX4_9BILA